MRRQGPQEQSWRPFHRSLSYLSPRAILPLIVTILICINFGYYRVWTSKILVTNNVQDVPKSSNGNSNSGIGHHETTKEPLDHPTTSPSTPELANKTREGTIIGEARHANGTHGYIADPTALRRGIAEFVKRSDDSYWNLLTNYQSEYRNGTFSGQELLSADYICAFGPGRGFEQDFGYRLLAEKIRLSTSTESSPRLLCLVYTHPLMRDLQRTQALSWGHKCDGYLAFSTETIPSLGILHLEHEGPEEYNNMWQKVRSLWTYVYKHYRHNYDFFHLGGDDLYLVVENLKAFLSEQRNDEALFLGQWIGSPDAKNLTDYYMSGGPGYTLNRMALEELVERALPSCHIHTKASYEDRLISKCLREIGIVGGDTRNDRDEQLYHDVDPAHLYSFSETSKSFHAKAARFWQRLPGKGNKAVGPKHGLEAAGTYSVSFHDIYHPLFMARLHAILFKTCPSTSPLGHALVVHDVA